MHKLFNLLRHRRDIALMIAALLLLIAAMFKPTIPVKRDVYSYLLVADITQSMNVKDMEINGKTVSRMAYQQYMLHRIVGELPCGTQVSIGLFAGVSVSALYTPIEICENFNAIDDGINHLEWRMAWSGNSRIRESMITLAKLIRSFPEPAQVVFFTDGEETPRLHIFNTRDLTGFQEGKNWLIVGMGSEKGVPIPKLDEHNQLIGYWANESFAMQPGVAQISQENIGNREETVANSETDRYLSRLDEKYLEKLSGEISGHYVNGSDLQHVLSTMRSLPPARRETARFELKWLLASLSGILFLCAYLPKHPIKELRNGMKRLLTRNRHQVGTTSKSA